MLVEELLGVLRNDAQLGLFMTDLMVSCSRNPHAVTEQFSQVRLVVFVRPVQFLLLRLWHLIALLRVPAVGAERVLRAPGRQHGALKCVRDLARLLHLSMLLVRLLCTVRFLSEAQLRVRLNDPGLGGLALWPIEPHQLVPVRVLRRKVAQRDRFLK